MTDPKSIDPSMLSESDRAKFIQSDEQRNKEKDISAEAKTPVGNFLIIKNESDGFALKSSNVDFDANDSVNFTAIVEKLPTQVQNEMHQMLIDYENFGPKMLEMIQEASQLRHLAERSRPKKLLDILLRHMQYAYKDKVEKLPEDKKQWVNENIRINSINKADKVLLSEIAESGFGVCRHLSVILLVLAKEAGMEGAYETADLEFTNLERAETDYVSNDNRKTLFRSYGANEIVKEGHAWVELKINDENNPKWIPVDPSTQLVGDTEERLETFKKAGYKTPAYVMPKFSSSKEVPSGVNTGFTIDQMIDLGVDRQEIKMRFSNKPVEVFHFKKGRSIVEPERFTGDLSIEINPVEDFFSGGKHTKINSIEYGGENE